MAVVGRLKAVLKRALRKQVGDAVENVCDAFVDELQPQTTQPGVGAGRNEADYECCRHLVEYIERNMETSPQFARQMNCVILAYQSNAPVEVLNSVVTQNLWVRRKGLESGENGVVQEEKKRQLSWSEGKDGSMEAVLKDAGHLTGGKVESTKGIGDIGTFVQKQSDRKGQAPSCVHEHSANRVKKAEADRLKGKVLNLDGTKEILNFAREEIKSYCNAGEARVPLKKIKRYRASKSNHQASIDKLVNGTMPKQKISVPQNEHPRVSPLNSIVDSRAVGNGSAIGSKGVSAVDKILSSTGKPVFHCKPPAKTSNSRLQTTRTYERACSLTPVADTNSKKGEADGCMTRISRSREWGKRKRLVTSKQPMTSVPYAKRARRALPEHFTQSDLSSAETDNSEDDNEGVELDRIDGADRRTGFKVKSASTHNIAGKAQKLDALVTATITDPPFAAKSVAPKKIQRQRSVKETPLTIRLEAQSSRAVMQKYTMVEREESGIGEEDVNEIVIAGKSAEGRRGAKTLAKGNDQSAEEACIDAKLFQVERDLAAGDESDEFDAAKRSFQAMLNAMIRSHSTDCQSSILNVVNSNKIAWADPIRNLCDASKQSPEQTYVFRTRLRDTILIIDALLCKPPRGSFCSRDCKAIRAQMCNEFTPCINPTCRTWHEAEAHSDACSNEQCEFKNRIMLRETMHLIEHKEQEIAEADDALELTNAALLSRTRRISKERSNIGNADAFKRIEALDNNLQRMKDELTVLIDTKVQHWAMLNSISVDKNADKDDRFPDFASHYTTRSHQRKKS